KFFGFSTHSNMEKCMMAASKMDWIDGIMMTYNYRIMNTPEMK
ncbi:MAG: aldo/keto reductase, partial [Desulfamplus sp.]|nr:aldo/keto reductase [Desulfamplus sp.]